VGGFTFVVVYSETVGHSSPLVMIDFILEKFNEFSSDGISSTLLAVILICIVLGFLKGFVKLVFFIFTIIGVGVAAYWGCESGLGFIRGFWSEVPDVSGNVIGALCGLVAFVILRKIFGFLADPVERSGFVAKFAFGIPAAIVSTALAIGLVWFSVNLLGSLRILIVRSKSCQCWQS